MKINIFLISLGFLVFSPVSSVLSLDVLGLPIAAPELFFIPFYFLLKKRLDIKLLISQKEIFLFWLFFLLLGISFLLLNFEIVSILSTARGYFYLLLSYVVYSRQNYISIKDLWYICFGSVLGWIILSLVQFNDILHSIATDGSLAVYGNMLALALFTVIPVVYNFRKKLFVAILLGVVLSLTSGTRRQILIFVISFLLSYIFVLRLRLSKGFQVLISTSILLIPFSLYYDKINNFFLELSPLLHRRIFQKTEDLLTGNHSGGDKLRQEYISDYFENIHEYILPKGFVSKRTNFNEEVGIFMDFPLLELSYMLGVVGVLLFLLIFLKYLIFHFKNFVLYNSKQSVIWSISGLILFLLLFLEGTNLTYSYSTPFTGLVLAKLFNKKWFREERIADSHPPTFEFNNHNSLPIKT